VDELIQQVERSGDVGSGLSLYLIAAALVLSFLLSCCIGWVYRHTHKGGAYSQSYVQTLVIMGTVVSLIMLIIGSNIARAFALVGALSIIRFRNAMKETRDVGFIFMVMAIGMAVGTRFFLLATFATACLSAFLLILDKFDLFAKEVSERILRIRFPMHQDYETAFDEPLRRFLQDYQMVSLETVRAGLLQEVVLSVTLKPETRPQALLEALRARNDNNKVTLALVQQEVDP
jgi:hypothetical protein